MADQLVSGVAPGGIGADEVDDQQIVSVDEQAVGGHR